MASNSNNCKNRPVQACIKDRDYFVRLVMRGKNPTEAKLRAGYAPNYSTTRLLNGKKTQSLITIGEERERLSHIPGFTFLDSCEVDKEIRDDPETPANTRLKANERIDKKLAYEAPTQAQGGFCALLLGFNDLGGDELQALLNHYRENREELPQDVV